MKTTLKIGLALGSGAARGWAHIGVIQRLQQLGIEPDIVCGTSIGGLVGAAYVSGNLDKLSDWVIALDKFRTMRYFSINRAFKGFVHQHRLRQFLDDFVVPKGQSIEQMALPFATVATDLYSGREIWNTQGNAADAVWASMSIPGLFPAIKLNDRWLLDGGLVNPVPVSLCRAMGADIVIAVNLNRGILAPPGCLDEADDVDTELAVEKPNGWAGKVSHMVTGYAHNLFGNTKKANQPPALLEAIAASINITQDRITRSRMAGDPPEISLSPRLSHIGILEFHRAREAIDEGSRCVDRHQRDLEYALNRVLS